VYGDATLGTKQKGEAIVDAVVEDLVAGAERLRTAPAPTPRPQIPW
jgi:creatinine amidohydrolase/Fe(II)-dependent formamide hydrolase-like protein